MHHRNCEFILLFEGFPGPLLLKGNIHASRKVRRRKGLLPDCREEEVLPFIEAGGNMERMTVCLLSLIILDMFKRQDLATSAPTLLRLPALPPPRSPDQKVHFQATSLLSRF